MSVKIRLSKTGKRHQISYRLVVQDTHAKRDGKFLEILGFYNPYNKPTIRIDQEKLNGWVKKGALPTPAVAKLLTQTNDPLRSRSEASERLTQKKSKL